MKLTKQQLKDKLSLLGVTDGDPEASHSEADKALLDYIGDKEVTKLFDDIKKWYA